MSELLPCPFCGGDAEQLNFETVGTELGNDPNAGGSCITCKRCGASSPVHFDRKENLYSSWNERSSSPAPQPATAPESGDRGAALMSLFEGRRYDLASRSDRAKMAEIINQAFAASSHRAAEAMRERAAAESGWQPIEEAPPFDEQPGRQFIRITGRKYHSGVRWARVWCGVAFIRPKGATDGLLGYRASDIIQMCQDGDMDIESARVTHWMPAIFPALPLTQENTDGE